MVLVFAWASSSPEQIAVYKKIPETLVIGRPGG
jgi:hypothetical protein